MKSFFKFFFASLLASITLIFLSVFVFGIIVSLSESKATIENNSVLNISFDAEIVERVNNDPFGSMDWMKLSSSNKIGLDNIKEALNAAAANDKIKFVFLEFSGFSAAPATLTEIRNALLKFKESGKPIYSYAEVYTQKALYLASVSDSIIINPAGMIELSGFSSNQAFYAKTFKKIGVEPQVVRGSNNKFKSAVEPFMNEEMSEANRKQITKLLDDLWADYKMQVAESRGISEDDIQNMADEFGIQVPKIALKNKMVDAVWYEDELKEFLTRHSGAEKFSEIPFTTLNKVIAATPKERSKSRDKIAVIYAVGDIKSGTGDENTIGSETIAQAIRDARLDDKVKAIVLRVNSPGGSAMASDVIWRETVLAQKEKPLVVSMGDYAASGGYYISTAADTIVAQPNTITGSIGVFMLFFTAQELLQEKMGVHFESVKTAAFADFGSLTRTLNEQEYNKLQQFVDYTYGDFIQKVAEGRSLDSMFVDSIGQGRVWSGSEAVKIGLVDVEGGLEDAINIAAGMAKLEDYKLSEYPKMKSPFEQLIKELTSTSISSELLQAELGENYHYLESMKEAAESSNTVQAKMEFDLIIN